MDAIFFNQGEYHELMRKWWPTYFKREFQPAFESSYGVVVICGDTPCAICYLYPTLGSQAIQLAFVCRNPEISAFKAGKALKLLASYSVHACKEMGYSLIYTATADQTVQKLFRDNDFFEGAKRSIEFVKEL